MSSHAIANLQYDEEHHEVASLNSWLETQRQEALKNPKSPSGFFCLHLDNLLKSTTLLEFALFQSLWQYMEGGIPETLSKALPQPPILRCTEDLEALLSTNNAAYVLLNVAEPRVETISEPCSEHEYEMAQRLHHVFTRNHEGDAVDRFVQALDEYGKMYMVGKHYGKSIAILQSSGTGKSRLMYELAKKACNVAIVSSSANEPYVGALSYRMLSGDEEIRPQRGMASPR